MVAARLAARESRRLQRLNWPVETHLGALDGDLDDIELLLMEIRSETRSLKTVMIGLLVSISSAAVIGALNLFFGGLKP